MSDGPTRDRETVRADRGGVGYLLNQAARSVRAKLAEDLRHHDLADIDFIVVRFVMSRADDHPNGVPTAGIAESLSLQPSEVDHSAEHLARIGWFKLHRRGGDLFVTPTQKAITTTPGIAGTARWTLEEALNGFSRDEISSLEEMLSRIIRNTETPEAPPQR